jgi:hypothetical protein
MNLPVLHPQCLRCLRDLRAGEHDTFVGRCDLLSLLLFRTVFAAFRFPERCYRLGRRR